MADLVIDTQTYRKDARLKPGQGYNERPAGMRPSSLVIHSTNGKRGSSFASEAAYLRDSLDVSAHYLVGKDGRVAQILPDERCAWHAGQALDAYLNARSIGIECHLTNGESWTDAQRAALTALVELLMQRWHIPQSLINTHRAVALPPGRKSDPASWTDADFAAWRSSLGAAAPPPATLHPILNGPSIPASDLVILLDRRAAHLTWQQRSGLTCAYSAFGELTTIGNLRPVAQAIKETDWFTSDRFLHNFNPAGMGATNDGAIGAVFVSLAAGVAAQYAHLLCYAAKPAALGYDLATLQLLSPRRDDLAQTFGLGCAPTWEDLRGKWAFPGPTYGEDVLTIAAAIADGRAQ